jgi:hypothetical protein
MLVDSGRTSTGHLFYRLSPQPSHFDNLRHIRPCPRALFLYACLSLPDSNKLYLAEVIDS